MLGLLYAWLLMAFFKYCPASSAELAGALRNSSMTDTAAMDPSKRVRRLLQKTPIVDTHIDFPYRLWERGAWPKAGFEAFALRHPEGQFDYERARKGGLSGAFMSIYVPAAYQQKPSGSARAWADSLIDLVYAIARAYPDKFAIAYRADDIERNFSKGIISLPMGMENGAPIEQLEDVAYFHRRGIRYITLTHSRDNRLSDSSYDTSRTHGGLSKFGREVVREMNRVGIMIDVSHLSDQAVWDVLAVSTRPVIATHSGCRHFTPGFERNLPDTLIRAIAQKGGVIQVPFSHYFISLESRKAFRAAEDRMKEQRIDKESAKARHFMAKELRQAGFGVHHVANHIDHIRRIAGIDHVGLGSDFDGVGLAVPPDLADVSMYPNLLAELFRRGYTEEDIRKICYLNVLRVWRANE
ncbi:MAG: dipeptidase [Saprospiraceae bacterium]|nr:dipeptidase [Saprospiraceae bacterium]MDW8484170.1 dipeptidase [Saprospiraceae bacterium]